MSRNRSRGKRHESRLSFLFLALLLSLGVFLLQYTGFLNVSLAPLPERHAEFEDSYIEVLESEEIAKNGIKEWQVYELFDSEPLFFPTIWNHASRHITFKDLQQESPLMQCYEPVLDINRMTLNKWLMTPDKWDLKPDTFLETPYTYGCWKGLRSQPFKPTEAWTESEGYAVTHMIDGEDEKGSQVLPLNEDLPVEWDPLAGEPAILMVQLGEEGMIGMPVLVQSSGITDWDNYAMNHIQQWEHYYKLNPGYHRIEYWP